MHLHVTLAVIAVAMYGLLPAADAQTVLVEDFRFGNFISAERIAADPFGVIYVTDGSEHCVQTFDSLGTPLRRIGGFGWGTDQFDHPTGVDASLGIVVYVADKGNQNVVRLDKSLAVIGSFSTRDDPRAAIGFGYPLDIAITHTGNLFILDGENRRVVSTSGFAMVENAFGGVESGAGRLQEPVAMALAPNDDIHVLERSRVAVFDVFGTYRHEYGNNRIADAKGIGIHRGYVYVVLPAALLVFKTDGSFVGEYTTSAFAFAGPISDFRDVIVLGDRLYLLTAKTVITFKP
jgi:hypothetical protein